MKSAPARLRLLALLSAFGPFACQAPPTGPAHQQASPGHDATEARADAYELAAWLTGSFSSANQAAADPENYYDIRLHTAPIWASAEDGPWLYVEQAAATALDQPYRQRVYRLVETDAGVRSDIYTLPGDPLSMAGAWRDPEAFRPFGPADLSLREGCSIYLTRVGNAYMGETLGEGCASTLRGAAFATSAVVVSPTALTSWDRGFDANGAQAWGATEGAYIFERTSDL